MHYIHIGNHKVSRFILGGNPFSGFSHQGTERDLAMVHYFTAARIKETIKTAEALGVNTIIARADRHMIRLLMEYRDEGSTIQWFAQTCPELGAPQTCIDHAASNGATACYIHGGVMDYLLAQGRIGEISDAIKAIRDRGMLAGIAGHNPKVFEWAEDHLDGDFYMCSYYNATHRDKRAEHVSGMEEWFLEEDRQIMTDLIQRLSHPVIHYKVLAAGRNDPQAALTFVASKMRSNDAVCVGVYPKDNPDMLAQDIAWLDSALDRQEVR